MKLTRKDFLKTSAILTGGLVLQGFSLPSILNRNNDKFKDIRNNFGIYSERGGTIGWYVSDDVFVVIDSQFPDTAKNFAEGIKSKTNRKIDFLFNTHHHGDHTAGNYYFKDLTSKIAAHENCPKLQKEINGAKDPEKQVYANITFADSWKMDIKSDIITAKYFGAAHTGGDSVIHFEKANVAHLGDLVFNKAYPYIDKPAAGTNIKNWINVLEKVSKYYDDKTIFIFGHAADKDIITGNKTDINNAKNYLDALLNYTQSQIKAGNSLEKAKEAKSIKGFESLKANWDGALGMNIEAAYNELSLVK